MISIVNFKNIILSKVGGKPLSKVENFYSLLYQAMLEMKSHVDIPSQLRTIQLTNPVYSNIKQYPIPSDVTLNGISIVYPVIQDNNDTYYDFNALNGRQMILTNSNNTYDSWKAYGIRNINGVQTLLINDQTTSPITIHNCESLTENGTVIAYGASADLDIDTLQTISQGGSIGFTCGVGASNGIQSSDITAVDLSEQKDILFYVYLPSITEVTGFTFSFGQDYSNYYQGSTTTDFFGNDLAIGWNLIRIPITSTMTSAGSPTLDNVVFFRVGVEGTFIADVEGFRVDLIVGQVGALYNLDYLTDYQFVSTTGTRMIIPTADTDSMILSSDEISLFTNVFISILANDIKPDGLAVDLAMYSGVALQNKYEEFKQRFPSSRQLQTTRYANRPNLNSSIWPNSRIY